MSNNAKIRSVLIYMRFCWSLLEGCIVIFGYYHEKISALKGVEEDLAHFFTHHVISN